MTANNSKSDLSYLSKLVDQYNSLYHHYFNKKAIKADFSALDENWSMERFIVNSVLRKIKEKFFRKTIAAA